MTTQLTNQEVFDRVATHLLKQGKRATLPGRSGCAYRNKHSQSCAIGCLIPDDVYTEGMECGSVVALFRSYGDLPKQIGLQATPLGFLSDLQEAHDIHLKWGLTTWRKRMREIAATWSLSPEILETQPS